MRVFLDTETASSTPITAGVYRYAADPTFRLLMAAWSVDGGPVEVTVGEPESVERLRELWEPGVTFVAHNAQFDRVVFSAASGLPEGEYLDPSRFDCTAAIAGELGLPQSLAKLATALGGEQKDTAGARLIRLFCVPPFAAPEEHLEEWADFVRYCAQDVRTLVDVDRQMGGFPTAVERDVYHTDQLINDRGILIDRALAQAAVVATDDNHMVQEIEMSALTGIANPNSNAQLLAWLRESGLSVADTTAETVQEALDGDLSPVQRRVLEIRQDLALVATKKYPAALASVNTDGRLRGGFKFFGAHTGRWSGRGVQPHNLPRAGFENPVDEEAAIVDLKLGLETDSQTLKKLVRALLVGPFTVVDYGSIEARVIAWLAGERWALQAFEDGRDIYTETAARLGGLTRFQGKVAVLALGFGGGVGSLRVMGAEGSDGELQRLVNQWRAANSAVVRLWYLMGEAFRSGGRVGQHLTIEMDGKNRQLRLPSGRAIVYRDCAWRMGEASFRDPRGRTKTYGGRLVENATQAVARDVLAEALVRLESGAYRVVAHTHDEAVVEGTHPVDEIVKIMCTSPSWAAGLPIAAVGAHCERYRKL